MYKQVVNDFEDYAKELRSLEKVKEQLVLIL